MGEQRGEQSTAVLLGLIRSGDDAAREELFRRSLPMLRRFAHGRLPHYRRDTAETEETGVCAQNGSEQRV